MGSKKSSSWKKVGFDILEVVALYLSLAISFLVARGIGHLGFISEMKKTTKQSYKGKIYIWILYVLQEKKYYAKIKEWQVRRPERTYIWANKC